MGSDDGVDQDADDRSGGALSPPPGPPPSPLGGLPVPPGSAPAPPLTPRPDPWAVPTPPTPPYAPTAPASSAPPTHLPGLPPPPPPTGYPAPYPGGYQPYGPPAMVNPFDSRATTVLVLGILGLVFCQLLAPVAWVMGNNLRGDAERAGYPEPGTGKAGRICGIVGTVLIGVMILFYVVFFVILAVGTANSGS